MNSRPLAFAASALAALAVGTMVRSAPPARPASPPIDPAHLTQMKGLYSEKCSACHKLYNPDEMGYTKPQWQDTVDRMLNRHHASDSISPAEAAQIVEYLGTFAPKASGRGGRSADPWATDATDVWTVAPASTRVFNFEAPDALASFSVVGAGAPGPTPLWRLAPSIPASADGTAALVRLVKPSPNRFALLLDRKDQARNLDTKMRFHIQSGKVSPSVGIVFGYSGPKSYEVLAYNAARNDLSLIKIAEPMHTMLQQTPVNLPATGPATAAAVTPASAPVATTGWHTLRLLVKDGQIRGWLDMNKRISTQDATYQGGKVGLWAQGDTVAAFDDWTVDVYDGASSANGMGA